MSEYDILISALGELKAELKSQHVTLSQVLDQARKTNGRITMLEEWRHAVELANARNDGLVQGASTAAVTKAQIRMFLGAATAIASIAGTVAGIVVKVMG